MQLQLLIWHIFFFNDTATTEIYTLSLHDALPIYPHPVHPLLGFSGSCAICFILPSADCLRDRKSTRLNSSHLVISYAVFCLKKKTVRVDISLGRRISTRSPLLCLQHTWPLDFSQP